MYTENELRKTSEVIRQVACQNHFSENEMRESMNEAITPDHLNPGPDTHAVWSTFSFAGDNPTPEEFILWAASQVLVNMQQLYSEIF